MCKKTIYEGGYIEIALKNILETRGHYDTCSESLSKYIIKNDKLPIFTDKRPLHVNSKTIPEYLKLDIKLDFFVIECSVADGVYPLQYYNDFALTAIVFTKHDEHIHHAVAFIKCESGWFFYNNERSARNLTMIPLLIKIENNTIIFPEIVDHNIMYIFKQQALFFYSKT